MEKEIRKNISNTLKAFSFKSGHTCDTYGINCLAFNIYKSLKASGFLMGDAQNAKPNNDHQCGNACQKE